MSAGLAAVRVEPEETNKWQKLLTDSLGQSALPAHLRPVSPFYFHGGGMDLGRVLDCLSAAAWYEAGNDPAGQRSVMQVVLNRVRSSSFPNDVCAVVLEGSQRKTGCQFTFTCDGSMLRRRPSAAQWELAQKRAMSALNGEVDEAVSDATHYHAAYVTPWWSSSLEQVSAVAGHIFYRWSGRKGQVNAGASGASGPAGLRRINLNAVESRGIALTQDAGLSASGDGFPVSTPESQPFIEARTVGLADARLAPGKAALIPINMPVDLGEPSGRWATTALSRCAGRAGCQVIGFAQAGSDGAGSTSHDRPIFLFVRDEVSGMELALWDCQRAERKRADQCLPASKAAVDRLMKLRNQAQ